MRPKGIPDSYILVTQAHGTKIRVRRTAIIHYCESLTAAGHLELAKSVIYVSDTGGLWITETVEEIDALLNV